MKNEKQQGLNEVFALFEENVSTEDIVSAMLLGKVSAAIVQSRLDLGLTQKEFANYLGVSQGMVSRWEGGNYNFTVKTLAEIADKLGLDFDIQLGIREPEVKQQGKIIKLYNKSTDMKEM